MKIITNFKNRKSNSLMDNFCFQIGGSNLMQYFFSKLDPCRSGGSITLITPFISLDENILNMMGNVLHRKFHINVFTDGDSNVSQALRITKRYSWGGSTIRQVNQLHAKVFICKAKSGQTSALISSQNLTKAGITKNIEAGVYFCCHNDITFNLLINRFVKSLLKNPQIIF